MLEYLIVDGYNVIGAWPELSRLKDVELEEARDRLIAMLAGYQAVSGMKIYLVFDAHQVPGLGGTYEQSRLTVIYTREKETADEAIERLVTGLIGRRRRVYVATNDMTEQHVIFGKGAFRLTARELRVKVRQGEQDVRKTIEEERVTKRNALDGSLTEEQRKLFEKWRRGGL